MEINKKDYEMILNKAIDKAFKQGFKRRMFFNEFMDDIMKYSFHNEEELIDYIVNHLMAVEKVCKMIDAGKISEFEVKSTKWCMW